MVWRRPIGDGFSSIVVDAGRVCTMGADAESEYALCLRPETGEEIWKTALGPRFVEEFGDGPRSTPAIDDDMIFALTSQGKLHGLGVSDGVKVWEVDLPATFGGRVPGRGVSSSMLVDGDMVIIEGGGSEGKAFQAFDRKTGAVRWTSQDGPGSYTSGITATIDGVRQEIFVRGSAAEIIALSPTGEKLWSHKWMGGAIAMPLFIPPNRIFSSTSNDAGAILVEVSGSSGKFSAREVWTSRFMKNHFNTSVVVGQHIYGFDNASLKCLAVSDGNQTWVTRGFGKGTLISADGLLFVLSDQGLLVLVDAVSGEYAEKGRFQAMTGKSWTTPSLSDGRLYLRDQDEIVAIDLTKGGSR